MKIDNNLDNYEGRTHSTKRPDQNVRSKEHHASSEFSSDKAELLSIMKSYGKPMTRLMIEEYSRFKANQITEHIKNLIIEGAILESKKKAPCAINGRNKYWLKVAEPIGVQQKLPLCDKK